MVLHLLGKKSWNVYNTDNVERVRRDEAAAKAREEAEEQRMQEEDADRRIALLRGEEVPPLPPPAEQPDERQAWRQTKSDDTYSQRDRKRRRIKGEDDTDRDIRYAKQDTENDGRRTRELLSSREKDAPLEDHAGHFQLIPAPDEVAIRKAEKNAEVEAEKAKKRKRDEDQYTMRFHNAAGFQNNMQKPWYAVQNEAKAASVTDMVLAEAQGKDVWGNEDPRRKERERSRISSNDPFAAMQQAQRQLKQSERDREMWQKQQHAELEQMKKDEKRSRRRRNDVDSLDGFSLDAPSERNRERTDYDRHRRHHHHHRRRRSRSKERHSRHAK